MSDQNYQWPPSRRPFESEEDWLVRLEQEIEAEHQRWLGKIASGDETVLIEITEWIVADEASEVLSEKNDNYDEKKTIDESSFKLLWANLRSRHDQHMAAVRNGDQDAVDEYVEFHLYTLKFNTMNENNTQEL